MVERTRLVEPLVDTSQRLALLVAPAGYGKTTVLRQWRAVDSRAFAWVSLTRDDDDPRRLLESIASALSTIRPVPGEGTTLDDLLAALPRLGPFVLVLDDAAALRSDAARDVVEQLVMHLPGGCTVAVAGRRRRTLPLGRLRAEDAVVELGADRLAMTRGETAELLRLARVGLDDQQTERLLAVTCGWPAALRLAVLVMRERHDASIALNTFTGGDGVVRDYVHEEVLSGLSSEERSFLRRTSVIVRLDGAACDAALAREDSAAMLRALLGASVPLVALDGAGGEYRHHPLLAQALRTELRRSEPAMEEQIHHRLSAFYERRGDLELAVEHAIAGKDADRVAALLAETSLALASSGRASELAAWLARLGDPAVAARPSLAVAAGVVQLLGGECETAAQWATIAATRCDSSTATSATVAAGAALVKAWCARGAVDGMAAAAHRARASTPPHGAWRALSCLVEGSALSLAGRVDEALGLLEEGARCALWDAPLLRSLCLAHAAWLTSHYGDAEDAAILARKASGAIASGPCERSPLAALPYAVTAYVHAMRGSVEAARDDLDRATRRLADLRDPAPWFGALVNVVQARVRLKLSDARQGRSLLSEASRMRRSACGAGALQVWIDDAWAVADDYAAGPIAYPTALTVAELRVLRMLPSHLTFREIAGRLHVSANTVKTQAHAVYRKLDARSRSEAVDHAMAVGLIEG